MTGKKPRLRITTPSIRPGNLPLIEKDAELLRAPSFFDVTWHVMVDCYSMGVSPEAVHHVPSLPWERVENVWLPRPEPRHGEDLYNPLMDSMDPEEWWVGLADDSLPEPGLFERLRREVDAGAEIVMFPMHIPGVAFCWSNPESIRPCHVSGGQVFYRRDVLGDLRWKQKDGLLDGVFLVDLWQRTGKTRRWHFADAPLLHHNQIRRRP